MADKLLQGRIALITGASRGIGAEIAKTLATNGAHVILTARTQGGLEEVDDAIREAGGDKATLVPLDLNDGDQIDMLGAAIHERFGKLDILVGNAGILGTLTPIAHIKPSEWDAVIQVNLTANYRLIRSLDPLLRQSEAARCVFLSSGTTKQARAYWATYAISKIGLEHMVQIYAQEMENTNVKANLLDPGATRTRMRADAYPGEDPMSLKTGDVVAAKVLDMVRPDYMETGQIVRL